MVIYKFPNVHHIHTSKEISHIVFKLKRYLIAIILERAKTSTGFFEIKIFSGFFFSHGDFKFFVV